MIEIDGTMGEGGGQILRAALPLAIIHNTGFIMDNIRAARPVPGLKKQHLTILKAIKRMMPSAEIVGANLGSRRVKFVPHGGIKGGKYHIDCGTAGSITLMAQALIPVALTTQEKVVLDLRGGTDVPFSPLYDYFKNVFLHNLSIAGVGIRAELIRRGYYPPGGGHVIIEKPEGVSFSSLKKIDIPHDKPMGAYGMVFISNLDPDIARRIKVSARKASTPELLKYGISPKIDIFTYPAISPGTGITMYIQRNDGYRSGGDSLGMKGKRAEIVGKECATEIVKSIEVMDIYSGDQMALYIAMAGGRIELSAISSHASTMVDVINMFHPDRLKISVNTIMT